MISFKNVCLNHVSSRTAAALLLSAAIAAPAFAAEEEAQPQAPQGEAQQTIETPTSSLHYGFNLGGAYQVRTDIDGGGDFATTRYSVGAGGVWQISDQLELNFNAGMERDDYRFSSVTRMGNDPWDSVNITSLQAAIGWHINQDLTFYATPLLGIAAEDGADWGRAVTYGGAAGLNYRFSDTLTAGFGLGIMTQLEDSVSVFPIVFINWALCDQLTLRSGTFDLGVQGGAGLELTWKQSDALSLAAGVQYQNRRFRLDRSGIAPDGVGQESAIPIYLRATWTPCRQFSVGGFAGVLLGGRLELDDADGHNITRKNFDPALVFGGKVSLNF